jgi:hypothetical protein
VTGEFVKAKCRIALNVQVPVFELSVRPCQLERSAAGFLFTIPGDQTQEFVTRLGSSGNEGDLPLPPGFKRKPALDCEYRIQDTEVRSYTCSVNLPCQGDRAIRS